MSRSGSDVPGWALASAMTAPIAMIGGWTLAASRQPAGYSSIHQTISALAAHGARDRWIMTLGFVLLGLGHLVTAAGLRPAHRNGRLILALGGAATIAVALFAEPAHGSSDGHAVAATTGFIALTAWPIFASRRSLIGPLNTSVSLIASVGLLALLSWLAATLSSDQIGLSERFLAGAQSLWPLAVVIGTRTVASRRRSATDVGTP